MVMFKRCPECDGPTSRNRDEQGRKYLSCFRCTWVELEDTDGDETGPPPTDPKGAVIHWMSLFLCLLAVALFLSWAFWPKK